MADEQDASSASPAVPDFAAFEAATLQGLPTNFEPTNADTAPAKPVDQAASTDATPKAASEPAKPKDKGAKARSAELDPEIAELQEKLRLRKMLREELDRGRDDKPAESSPAPVKATQKEFARFRAMPDAPKIGDFEAFEDWSVEMSVFVAGKRLEEFSEEFSRKQKQDYDAGQFRDAQSQFDAKGVEAFPDFRDVLTAAAQSGRRWPEHVTRKVFTHADGPAIAYALAQAKDDDALYQRIADPVDFGEYVGEFLAARKAPSKKSTLSAVPKTPEPPVVLGSRPHDTTDPEQAAVAAGDFSSFEAALMAKLRPSA